MFCSKPDHRGRTLVCIKNTAKRQRRGEGDYEVTVISERTHTHTHTDTFSTIEVA